MFFGILGELQIKMLTGEAFLQECDLQVDNFLNVLPSERVKHNSFIDPIQKFRKEVGT